MIPHTKSLSLEKDLTSPQIPLSGERLTLSLNPSPGGEGLNLSLNPSPGGEGLKEQIVKSPSLLGEGDLGGEVELGRGI